jgi:hypothetical protein
MKAYEVINGCSISYTKEGENKGFVLNPGDVFFIEPNSVWVIHNPDDYIGDLIYIKKHLLTKIYYKKFLTFGYNKPEDTIWEWTWIENINLVEPRLNGHLSDYFDQKTLMKGTPYCKDVTQLWEREEKLKNILNK